MTDFRAEVAKGIAAVIVAALSAYSGYKVATNRQADAVSSASPEIPPTMGVASTQIVKDNIVGSECVEKLKNSFENYGYRTVLYTTESIKFRKDENYLAFFCKMRAKELIYSLVGPNSEQVSDQMIFIRKELRTLEYFANPKTDYDD